jgi:site-specific recombinase XerD
MDIIGYNRPVSLLPAVLPHLPDWDRLASLAVDAVPSPRSKTAYRAALRHFFSWYLPEAHGPISRAVVQQYRSELASFQLSPATVNLHLSAIRKLVSEAAENGLLDRTVAQTILSLKGPRQAGNNLWQPPPA